MRMRKESAKSRGGVGVQWKALSLSPPSGYGPPVPAALKGLPCWALADISSLSRTSRRATMGRRREGRTAVSAGPLGVGPVSQAVTNTGVRQFCRLHILMRFDGNKLQRAM